MWLELVSYGIARPHARPCDGYTAIDAIEVACFLGVGCTIWEAIQDACLQALASTHWGDARSSFSIESTKLHSIEGIEEHFPAESPNRHFAYVHIVNDDKGDDEDEWDIEEEEDGDGD